MFAMMISVLMAIMMVSSKCLNGWRGGTFVGIRSTKSRLRGSLEQSSPSPRSGEPKAKAWRRRGAPRDNNVGCKAHLRTTQHMLTILLFFNRRADGARPVHSIRSRRALLTHRAPPSGQTSYDERFGVARRPTRSHYSDRRGISAQCPNRGRLTAVPLG